MKITSRRRWIINTLINQKIINNYYIDYNSRTGRWYVVSSYIVHSQRLAFSVKQIQDDVVFTVYQYDGVNQIYEQFTSERASIKDLSTFHDMVRKLRNERVTATNSTTNSTKIW